MDTENKGAAVHPMKIPIALRVFFLQAGTSLVIKE